MPIKNHQGGTDLTKQQKECLFGRGWLAIAGTWPMNAMREAWKQNRDELMNEWTANPENLFLRPSAWWDFDAPEERRILDGEEGRFDEVLETEFSYIRRHPELQTPTERKAKLSEATIRWRSMAASEMANKKYILANVILLNDDERASFEAYLAQTAPAAPGSVQ